MIHYQLRCGAEHPFDGWFRDSGSYESQAAAGLLACPLCGSTSVARALMAPAVGKRLAAPAQTPSEPASGDSAVAAAPAAPSKPVAVGAIPDQMRAMLQRMRAEVEKRCDYVGATFADEARKMHSGESEPRPIYGEATPEQAQRLEDDGIEVSQIPWISRADS